MGQTPEILVNIDVSFIPVQTHYFRNFYFPNQGGIGIAGNRACDFHYAYNWPIGKMMGENSFF